MSLWNRKNTTGLKALKLDSGLAFRQLKYSFGVSVLLGFIIFSVQVAMDYFWLENTYQMRSREMVEASLPTAIEALKKNDPGIAASIGRIMDAEGAFLDVSIKKKSGEVLFTQTMAVSRGYWEKHLFGGLQHEAIPLHRQPTVDEDTATDTPVIGFLSVTHDPAKYVHALFSRAVRSLVTMMTFAILMAMVFSWMFNILFVRPLINFTNFIIEVDPTDLKHSLPIPPKYSRDDELMLLSSMTVGLFGMIRQQILDLAKARDALKAANENLERRVELRTEELNTAMQRLEVLAATDSLTNLANRREFMRRLELAMTYWKKHGTAVSLVLLDIDHFKKINDTYGHQAGDDVLVSLAKILTENLREIDLAARLGGEEFAIMIIGESHAQSLEIAERIRKVISENQVPYLEDTIRYSASFGVVSLPFPTIAEEQKSGLVQDVDAYFKAQASGDLIDILYKMADEALYEAKKQGRNRCIEANFQDFLPHNGDTAQSG